MAAREGSASGRSRMGNGLSGQQEAEDDRQHGQQKCLGNRSPLLVRPATAFLPRKPHSSRMSCVSSGPVVHPLFPVFPSTNDSQASTADSSYPSLKLPMNTASVWVLPVPQAFEDVSISSSTSCHLTHLPPKQRSGSPLESPSFLTPALLEHILWAPKFHQLLSRH